MSLVSKYQQSKIISLTQGKVTLVDEHNYAWLNQFEWQASKQHRNWYAVRNVRLPNGKWTKQPMHRLIMGVTDPKIQVDHKNGDGLLNTEENLRLATNVQNHQNSRVQKNNSSGVRGIYWDKDHSKWRVRVWIDGKAVHLGYFGSLREAKAIRDAAEIAYYGAFSPTLSRPVEVMPKQVQQ